MLCSGSGDVSALPDSGAGVMAETPTRSLRLVSSIVTRAVSPSRRLPSAAQTSACMSSRFTAMPTNPPALSPARTALRTATPCPSSSR